MGLPYLPGDLWRSEILIRLPVKSVLSCKYVCKSWYSLIETHDFQQLHLRIFNNNYADRKKSFFLPYHPGTLKCRALKDRDTYTRIATKFKDHIKPLDLRDFYYKICDRVYYDGYVDGILLAQRRNSDKGKDDVISLWNLSMGKGLNIPIPRERLDVFGFGLDTVTSSYKIVGFYVEQQLSSPPNYNLNYNVYNVGDGTWSSDRRAKLDIYVERPIYVWMTYFEGVVYWICESDIHAKYSYSCLLGFNLTTEQFMYLRLPKIDDTITELGTSIGSRATRLSVSNRKLIFSRFCNYLEYDINVVQQLLGNNRVGSVVCIWAREKESWVKLYKVDLMSKEYDDALCSNVGRVFGSSSDSTSVHLHLDNVVCVYQESLVLHEQFTRSHSNDRTITTSSNDQLIHSLQWCGQPAKCLLRIEF